jgi:hypothetical protein
MKKIYLGLFLISLATLALEIYLTRLFSISLWYHFAFLVVSIAMLGLAAAGTFLSIKQLKNPLPLSSFLFSISAIVGFFVVNNLSFDPFKAALDPWHLLVLLLYYLALGLPFFFSGIIITFILTKFQSISGKIYFYNLAGSAIGSIAVLLALSILAEKTILIIALLGATATFCFSFKKINLINSINLILIIIVITSIACFSLPVKMSPYKELNQALNYQEAKILDTQQNSFSQVDVVESPYVRYAPGLSSQFRDDLPEQKGITVDGANLNAITKRQEVDFLNYLPTSIPFSLIENPKTLVLNAGAGLDVLMALENNAQVTALESNPLIINLLQNKYKEFSGNIFNQAEIINNEGRSFIKNAGQYDVIIISQAGQLASSSAGLYSFSENYLFTEESIQNYYEHLTDQGVLVITGWLSYPPKEALRLFSLAQTIPNAENKIAAFRSWTTFTLLLNKNDFLEERINKIKNFTEKNKFDLIYLAQSNFTPNQYGQFEEPYYYNAIQQILTDKQQFYDGYLFDVTPVTDEKPFYSNFFKWSKVKELYQLAGTKWHPFLDSGFMLLFLFSQALILSLVFVLLPIKFFKQFSAKKISLIYFLCLGLGYLFVEIVLIQKFILFLGHITYAISTVIFAVLIFSSLGSLISQKYSIKKLPWLITILVVLIIVYALVLPAILNSLIGYSLLIKMLFTVLLIAPLAFIMGMPFPLGLRAIQQPIIPWALAVNGSASVLSAIMATLIALSTGYSFVLVLAALLYLTGIFFIKPSISARE